MIDVASGQTQAAAPGEHKFYAPRYGLREGFFACAGVFIVIGALAFSSFRLEQLLLLGSFGSSAVMMFSFPQLHFSQPRSVVGGHFICSAVGLAALTIFGHTWWGLALGCALALALMMLTRTVHPPAGSNPVIVYLTAPKLGFLLYPTLFGALTMVAVAVLYHRARKQAYPAYWV